MAYDPYSLSGGAMTPEMAAAMERMASRQGETTRQQIENQYKLGTAQLKNSMKIAQMESGDRRRNIEAERDMNRERIAQARLEMERIGIPEMEIKRFVAEKTAELAAQELALKREVFLVESGLARDQLNKDIREMEEIGIPRVQIERYAAEQAAALGQLEYGLKRDTFAEEQRQFGLSFEEGQRQYDLTHAEQARQFNVGASGYLTGPGGEQQATLERERFTADEAERARQYQLGVAKFGAELGSTPDTYFQARRFQGTDIPRLMGGAAAPTQPVYGGPTPQISTLGARLAGADPAAVGGQGYPAAAGGEPMFHTLGMPDTPEDDRQKQIAKVAAASPPSPYDGLDPQDQATLRLMSSIYEKGGQSIAGGEYERLKASGRLGYLQSAGRLLGHDPAELESQYNQYRPAQGAASAF